MNKLFAALAAAALMFSACASSSKETKTDTAATATTASELKKPGEAQVGDKTTCPVSGEEFTVASDSPKYEYKGKTFYTCCADCVGELQANPEKYLGQYAP